MNSRNVSLNLALVTLFAAAGCDPEEADLIDDERGIAEEDEDEDDVDFRIAVGTNDVSSPVRNAVVLVGGCTGTLVAPDLVLTAAHCGYENPAFFTGGWTTLPSLVPVRFGPNRSAPIHTAWANSVSAPPLHTGGPNWVDDMVLLRLTSNIPAHVAVPRPVYLDHPAPVQPHTFPTELIYQIGYGGNRNRRIMTGGNYRDWLTVPSIPHNGFQYTAHDAGPGIGDRDTNVEGGDSGGPMLLNSDTGPVMGVLSFWEPYGIATYGPGTGGRSPIRAWLTSQLPVQKPDFTVVSVASGGCTGPAGDPLVAVTIKNQGAVTNRAWVDVFTGLASPPPIGTYSNIYRMSDWLAPEGTQTLFFAITNGFEQGWVDVLVDTTQTVDELDETNNHRDAWLTMPDCSFN